MVSMSPWYLLYMALPQTQTRTQIRKNQKGSFAPYLFHFGLFVVVFFSIIGGALFILNFASAYGV